MCDRFVKDSTQMGKLCRRLTFTKEDSQHRSFYVNICSFTVHQDVNWTAVLLHLSQKGLSVKNYYFVIESLNIKCQAGDKVMIPLDVFLKDKEVLIKMFKIDEELQSNSQEEKSNSTTKKPREPERHIRDVIYKLKKWRLLHEQCNLSLINAAKEVEVQKKTLDDYYFAIRVGEIHGYNFEKNLNEKVGHLREFIRNQPTKVKGKLDKRIQSFELVPDPDLNEYVRESSRWLDEIMEDISFVPFYPQS